MSTNLISRPRNKMRYRNQLTSESSHLRVIRLFFFVPLLSRCQMSSNFHSFIYFMHDVEIHRVRRLEFYNNCITQIQNSTIQYKVSPGHGTNIHQEPATSSCSTQAPQIIVHQTSKHSTHTPFMGSPLLLTLWPITMERTPP